MGLESSREALELCEAEGALVGSEESEKPLLKELKRSESQPSIVSPFSEEGNHDSPVILTSQPGSRAIRKRPPDTVRMQCPQKALSGRALEGFNPAEVLRFYPKRPDFIYMSNLHPVAPW
jgi:hypothetical protein